MSFNNLLQKGSWYWSIFLDTRTRYSKPSFWNMRLSSWNKLVCPLFSFFSRQKCCPAPHLNQDHGDIACDRVTVANLPTKYTPKFQRSVRLLGLWDHLIVGCYLKIDRAPWGYVPTHYEGGKLSSL